MWICGPFNFRQTKLSLASHQTDNIQSQNTNFIKLRNVSPWPIVALSQWTYLAGLPFLKVFLFHLSRLCSSSWSVVRNRSGTRSTKLCSGDSTQVMLSKTCMTNQFRSKPGKAKYIASLKLEKSRSGHTFQVHQYTWVQLLKAWKSTDWQFFQSSETHFLGLYILQNHRPGLIFNKLSLWPLIVGVS